MREILKTIPTYPAKIINQKKALKNADRKEKNLRERGKAPAPENADADEDDYPFDRGHDISIMAGVPIRNRAEIPEFAEGEEVPVGIFGMDGQVFEGM